MPELRCPECGNELLPRKPDDLADYCVCSSCNRKVYTWGKTGVNVKCSKCGKENVAEAARSLKNNRYNGSAKGFV